jgi:hypothetical protein
MFFINEGLRLRTRSVELQGSTFLRYGITAEHLLARHVAQSLSFSLRICIIRHSKIGNVMRLILTLPEGKIPNNDEFNFRQRAGSLVEKWTQ